MDSHDIFRKLSVGAVFKKAPKRPENNREIGFACQTKKRKTEVKVEPIESVDLPSLSPCQLLGNITSNATELSDVSGKTCKNDESSEIKPDEVSQIRRVHKIHINGSNPPAPFISFNELATEYNLSACLLENIKACGYTTPTPIQMQAIPVMLRGRQILACAPTGSGKTLAFLIPIIHQLRRPRNKCRALIVSPTRELSRQTYRECSRLCEGTGLRIHITTKLKDTVNQSRANSDKYDILITTPNRLVYLINKEQPISLKSVEWLIIDESDKLFETGVRGFRDQLAVIYQACDASNVKRAMFSATHTVQVAKWCRQNLKRLISVNIGHRNTTVDTVEQKLTYVGNEEGKLIAMRDIIKQGLQPPVLIFLQSKERARELFCELLYDGINVDVIHADRTQLQRDNVVKAFREGKIWVLICTELMGRGIDFKGVNLVINYDFPPTAVSYIHRIGRTGRAGRPGKAVTFFTDEDSPYLRSIANVMKESGCPVPDYLLSLKRPHKNKRRKLESKLPSRPAVSKKPHRYNRNNSSQSEKESVNKKKSKRSSTGGITS